MSKNNSSHCWSVASIVLWSRKLYRQMEDVSSVPSTTPQDSVHSMLGQDLKAQLFEKLGQMSCPLSLYSLTF